MTESGTPVPDDGTQDRAPEHSRRTFLRAALVAGTGVLALAACTDTGGGTATTSPATEATTIMSASGTSPTRDGRVLLAYFSRAGENYWNGGRRDLETGNTEVLAGMIADRLGCDVYRIEAADPYPHAYQPTVERNVREQDADARPAIADPLPDVRPYDTVILASPIWNVRPPMIMSTFVENAGALDGKLLLPVTTYAMSGLGRAVEVYTELAPGATLGPGLAVQGEKVRDAGPDVDDWLADL